MLSPSRAPGGMRSFLISMFVVINLFLLAATVHAIPLSPRQVVSTLSGRFGSNGAVYRSNDKYKCDAYTFSIDGLNPPFSVDAVQAPYNPSATSSPSSNTSITRRRLATSRGLRISMSEPTAQANGQPVGQSNAAGLVVVSDRQPLAAAASPVLGDVGATAIPQQSADQLPPNYEDTVRGKSGLAT
ncbi:hypothetical protein JCM11641_003337 [Rhodosporidiobolus odoratus]